MAVTKGNEFNQQIRSVSFAGGNIKHEHKTEATIHTSNNNFPIDFLITTDINRDYTGNLGDETVITCKLPLGDFVYWIYPEREDLEITIVFTTVGLKYDAKYKAIITSVAKEVKDGTLTATPIDYLNKEDYTQVSFQLLDDSVEAFKRCMVHGGVYKKCPVSFPLTFEIGKATGEFSFFGVFKTNGIEMVTSDNWTEYRQIVLPHDLHSKDVPMFLQAEYGIYNGGISTYIQNYENKSIIFIYPPYKPDGSGFFKRRLSVFLTNNIEVGALNNTYTVTDDEIRILGVIFGTKGTGDLKRSVIDYTKALGNTIKAANTSEMDSRPVKVSPKAIKPDGDGVVTEVANMGSGAESNKQIVDGGRTENLYALRSVVLQNSGKILHMQWAFSNARYLTPGMAVDVHLRTEEGIERFSGILHGVHISYENNKKMEACQLAVFFKKSSNIFDFFSMGMF